MKDYAAKPLTKNMATKTGARIGDTIAAIATATAITLAIAAGCLSIGGLFGALLSFGFFL